MNTHRYSEKVIISARKVAKRLIREESEEGYISFGTGRLLVSRNPNAVLGTENIIEQSVTFYIGVKA